VDTVLHWPGQIGILVAVLVAAGICVWAYESRAKRKKFEAAFGGREPLDERTFYEGYFQARGVPAEVAVKVRRVLEEVLDADLSRLRAEDDFARNLSFFFQYDSMADVELVQRLEEEFGIEIADAEAAKASTVEEIVSLVWSELRRRAA
jgi:acyl carrier protein